jgi:methionyl-tRNA synthetase
VKVNFKRYLVTAALPYANGKIHLGHLAGAYLPSDIYVRYLRSMKRDVVFVCGSDEHGVAITITAEQEKTTPQAVVDKYHALNKAAFEKFGMSFDNYSRTSLPLHHETAREFFLKIQSAGILKEKRQQQLYDGKAKMFLPDRYVEGTCPKCGNPDARGDQCERCGTFLEPTDLINPKSKITGETPVLRETTHFYFPLGAYGARLEEYVASADKRDGWKENVLQYCRGWFKEGLQDRAVTRDLEWGVKIPLKGFEHKVLYVWFDAVLGYISGTKEWAAAHKADWKTYWLDKDTKYVAFIGKDNVVFHCIVFPAILMAWNDNSGKSEQYILPENVPANEFLNFQGQKFSKSRGWGIDVDDFLAEFPADTLRYMLAMNMPEARDADFYWKDFQARTNNELADILGNFVNRTLTFAHKNFEGKVPAAGKASAEDAQVREDINKASVNASEKFEAYRFREGILEIMNVARSLNKYFDAQEPWKALKEHPERCAAAINTCLQGARALAILLEPVIPFASAKIWNMLGLSGVPQDAGWESASSFGLNAGHALGKPEILFTKIEDDVIQKHVDNLGTSMTNPESVNLKPDAKGVMPEPAKGGSDLKPQVAIDDFRKLDFRIAKVLEAEKVPKSDKLLKLQVSLGSERRQVVAGIAQHYNPEDLVGKKIVVVANLAPAKIMGQESQGMLLAASNSEGKLTFLTGDDDIEEGSVVK